MKMNKTKKGFTIVELVIVIAIIAILAAVLIPTFANLIKRANVSKDNQLVRNLNTALLADKAINGDHKTMQSALDAVAESGYLVDKINASAKENEILWDQENDVFCYLNDGNIVYIPNSVETDKQIKAGEEYKLWKVYSAIPATSTYSIYLAGTSLSGAVTANVGIDVGNNIGINEVTYRNDGSEKKPIIIRTNSVGTTLTVDAKDDTVLHYGNANIVNVTAVAQNSYHENGSVASLNVKEGKIEVTANAFVGKISVDKDATADTVKIINQGTIFSTGVVSYSVNEETKAVTVAEETGNTGAAATIAAAVTTTNSSSTLKIGTADALINLASAQTQGLIETVNFELTADIDLTGKAWVPFGANEAHTFSGSINGNGHKIIGLTNKYTNPELLPKKEATTSGISGEVFGLIAYACGEDGMNLTISNLTLDKVDIAGESLKNVAALIGNLADIKNQSKNNTITINKVKVSGSIQGMDKVASLIGGACHNESNTNVNITISDCENNANINAYFASNYNRAGGFVAAFGSAAEDCHISFENCTNNGNVSATGKYVDRCFVYVGTLIGQHNLTGEISNQVHITNCVNNGKLTATDLSGNKKTNYVDESIGFTSAQH